MSKILRAICVATATATAAVVVSLVPSPGHADTGWPTRCVAKTDCSPGKTRP